MRRVTLILEPTRPAIFSESAATEGLHRTLVGPTGTSLLGFAAAGGRYAAFAKKGLAFTIFHSGKVRFSNALPLTSAGHVGYPLPRVLKRPKQPLPESDKDGALPSDTRVGDPDRTNGEPYVQHETLKAGYMTLNGLTVEIRTSFRQRTAIENGRAKTGALFGFRHIEAAPNLRYVVTIEADHGVLTDADWNELIAPFRAAMQAPMDLGRYANNGYGGGYCCTVLDDAANPWPHVEPAIAAIGLHKLVFVWALSDLALTTKHGMPDFAPSAEALGLGFDGSPDSRWSSVTTRRYALWNAHLKVRDVERQVIAAGSVLAYDATGVDTATIKSPAIVGTGRACGLGRVFVTPPVLASANPRFQEPAVIHIAAPETGGAESNPSTSPEATTDLAKWAKSLVALAERRQHSATARAQMEARQ